MTVRLLIVEDDEQLGGMCARELSREPYLLAVESVSDPRRAVEMLATDAFDAVVVDLVYTPLVEALDTYRSTHALRPMDRFPLVSGLAVAAAAQETRTGVVVWTSIDLNRRLHLVFAYEELGVRAFCSKRAGGGELRPLYEAVSAAARGRPYSEAVMDPYLPAPGAIPLGQMLFGEQSHRPIWRALALGHHTSQEVAAVTGYKQKTVRNLTPAMYRTLQDMDHGIRARGKTQAELVRYATDNRYFFLDETVREFYP
ncbi:hypothetical protein [Salinactinospora qingdaonensis]|uniref:Response regulatory domain-containing protein n=1 Tax=Salinactinospora qingdaonensis TaxID=702744 RepID=A0ABP7FGS2_9ACTN